MKPLSDAALRRLQQAATVPDVATSRYTLVRELGRGGMGVVYLAEDRELGRKVALKVFHLDDVSPALRDRLRQEARTLARLDHPHIVPIYDLASTPDGRLYYAMKYVEGHRLDVWAQAAGRTIPERLRLLERLCEALAFAHAKGVVHRDLKPQNIMAGEFGEVFVMDWGLAKSEGSPEPGALVVGTPGFMAPEQQHAPQTVDHRADIFALGRILSTLAGDDPPKAIAAIAAKAQAADPEQRYATAKAMAADLLNYLDGLRVSAHRETAVERLLRFAARNRTLLLLLLTYVVIRAVIFFGFPRPR